MPGSNRTSTAGQGPRGRAGRAPRPLADAAKLANPRPSRGTAEQLGPYLYRIPMSSGVWAISTDDRPGSVQPRGLYQQERDPEEGTIRHVFRASLPYVHARIVRRDGSGARLDTDYLISAAEDGPRVIVTSLRVRKGDWAGAVGLSLSDDPKIIQAAGTAIRHMTPLDGEYGGEREAIPRCEPDGRVTIPAAETLPAGYLRLGHLGRAEALARWREIIAPVAAGNPQFALVLGGSAVSPFAGWLDYSDVRAFILDMAGEPNGGKSTTARAAGAIWGEVPKNGNGVVGPWNLSAQGPGRVLGMLGILPAIFDEQGAAGYSPDVWARTILSITDGSRRAADRDGGIRVTHPYSGVVISAGNASIAAGLGAGRYAGIGPKRVNTLTGPFTGSAEQAESVKPVLRDAHGHVGRVILERFTGGDVAALVKDAARLVPFPSGVTARSAAKNLHLLIAGAAVLDRVLGTGAAIRDSAASGAREYLAAHSSEPEHDSDRMLAALRDSLAAMPARWPTVAEYREHRMPRPTYGQDGATTDPGRVDLPQHGVDRHLMGVRADDCSWFAVFGFALDDLLAELQADKSVALAEADRRGWLHRTGTDRRSGKMATFIKHVGRAHRFDLPAVELEDQDQAPAVDGQPPAVGQLAAVELGQDHAAGFDGGGWGPGTNGAAANPVVLCSVCGDPLDSVLVAAGLTDHGETQAEPTPAPAVPAPFARAEQNAALARAIAVLDAGPKGHTAGQDITDDEAREWAASLRMLAALEGDRKGHGPFAPMRGRRGPWWQAAMPPIAVDARTSAWTWQRDGYAGPVVALDRNGAFPSAASSVTVAHGGLEDTGPLEDITGAVRPGYYLVNSYPWTETGIPHPLGSARPGEQVWIAAPRMTLLRDLAAAGRWPDASAAGSWTGEPCRLRDWAAFVGELRKHARTVYGRGSDQDGAVKDAFGQARGLLTGSWAEDSATPRKTWKCKARRLDWAQHIEDQAAVTLWRAADECRQLAPELGPVALRNTDELVLPSAALEVVTSATLPGRARPPVRIDPSGIAFGTFKVKTEGQV